MRSEEPPPRPPTGEWFRDHLLSLILGAVFLLSLIGQEGSDEMVADIKAIRNRLGA